MSAEKLGTEDFFFRNGGGKSLLCETVKSYNFGNSLFLREIESFKTAEGL